MANQEHLEILKQGVNIWNKWRNQHLDVRPDLSFFNLSRANLSDADLSRAKLNRAKLTSANLVHANLVHANLYRADLSDADLRHANLLNANLLSAGLSTANLRHANLLNARLNRADLSDADFSQARVGGTAFIAVDLRSVKGLETIEHQFRSIIDIDTIYLSQGTIPEIFLQGAGVDDTFISYIHSLVGKAIEYYSCFISYSSKDEAFAKRLYADLQSNNVRCWFAPKDMKIGDKIRPRIDEAIRIHDKLLLVLSEHAVESDWVEKEVETAFEKERHQQKLVLFPIRLDEMVLMTTQAWAADIRRTRHIGDFTQWKEHDAYQKALNRLLRALNAGE